MLTNNPNNQNKPNTTEQPFDLNHLKKVITELDQAEKMLEKKEHELPSRSGLPPLSLQMKREQFAKEVVETTLFKSLQQAFFKIIPQLGQKILMVCNDVYNNQKLTNEQRDTLATIGNKLSSELPFKMLSGSIDVKQGFSEFMGVLRMTYEFLETNRSLAVDVGLKILSIFKPLKNFITSTKAVVEKSDAPKPIKEGFQERLTLIEGQSNKVTKVVESSVANPVQPPSIDLEKLIVNSPWVQELQKNLLAAIFPIGGTILNVGFSLFNSGVFNDKQRKELSNIGMEISNLPTKLLTGKIDLAGVVTGLTDGLKSLGSFFTSNPDIAVRAGSTILSSTLPLGGFLQKAFSFITTSEPAQNAVGGLLTKGLGLLSKQFSSLENTLETSALRVLAAPQK